MENNAGKFKNFMKKNGFYVGLLACVLVVGVAVFLAAGSQPVEEPQGLDVQKQEAPNLQEELAGRESAFASPIVASPTPSATPSPSPSASKPTSGGRASVKLTMPLDGEIIKSFSGETLIYNPTLNMWMTHNGIDISAAKQTKVVAALAGEVKDVQMDESKGQIVTLTHANGRETRYYGLSAVAVETGAKVNAGQELGTAGTPPFEASQGAHLHFEYLVDNAYVDPVEVMGK